MYVADAAMPQTEAMTLDDACALTQSELELRLARTARTTASPRSNAITSQADHWNIDLPKETGLERSLGVTVQIGSLRTGSCRVYIHRTVSAGIHGRATLQAGATQVSKSAHVFSYAASTLLSPAPFPFQCLQMSTFRARCIYASDPCTHCTRFRSFLVTMPPLHCRRSRLC